MRFETGSDAVAWHLDGESYIHPTANTAQADIGENVQVMADADIRNSTIENSVIFPEGSVIDCEIRRTIIDKDTSMESLRLSGAVIGAHTRMSR